MAILVFGNVEIGAEEGGILDDFDVVDDVEGFEDFVDEEVDFDEEAGLARRLEERKEEAEGLEGGGFAFSFATSLLGGLLGGGTDLGGGFPYAETSSRMRCALASAASTIWEDAETSSDSNSAVGWGGLGGGCE